jgi:hypothetical protein
MGLFDFLGKMFFPHLSMGFGDDDEGGGGESQAMFNEGRWEVAPQYSFTEPRLQLTNDFITQNLQRLQEGKYPVYYENALPTIRGNLARPLQETYYGRRGERSGLLQNAYEVGSITGLGPSQTAGLVNKQLLDYATKEKQIDEYLTKLGVDIMQSDSINFMNASMAMPKGPDATWVEPGYLGQVNPGSQSAGFGGILGSVLDVGSQFLRGQEQTTPQPTTQYSNYDSFRLPYNEQFTLRNLGDNRNQTAQSVNYFGAI